MFQTFGFSFRSIMKLLSPALCLIAVGFVNVGAQEAGTSRPVLDVDGNKVFSKQELLDIANKCLDRISESGQPFETAQLEYCLHRVATHMRAKGYLQARLGKTLYNQDENVSKATIPVEEGALFRVGEIKIQAATIFAPAQIIEMIGLNPGDVANGEKFSVAIYERLKEAYSNFGYIRYTAEINPTFHLKEGALEGVADFAITIDEDAQFRIHSIKFTGGDKATIELLRRELMVRDGEVYSSDLFSKSITRMNYTGLYDQIDMDKDVDYQTNEKAASLDLTIRLKKKMTALSNP